MAQIAITTGVGLIAVVGHEKIMSASKRRSILRVAEDSVLLTARRDIEASRLFLLVHQAENERVLVGLVLVARVPFGARIGTVYVAVFALHNHQCVRDVVAARVET